MPDFSDTVRVPPTVPPPPTYANGLLIKRGRKVPKEGPYLLGDRIRMIGSFGAWYQENEIAILVRPVSDDFIGGDKGWWIGYVLGRETCFYVSPDERGKNWELL